MHESDFRARTIAAQCRDDYFDTAVTPGGYRWWYLDVVSDCGEYSVVVIGFIGSVFSPYYARARKRGKQDPFAHCAINPIIYGPRGKRWAMTERTGDQFSGGPDGIAVGPSSMRWRGDALIVDIDEVCNPWPRRIRGRIVLHPQRMQSNAYALHGSGRHRWWPAAPLARAEVAFEDPALTFSGSAYLDTNVGDEPLESGFLCWDWTRTETPTPGLETPALTYHTVQRDGHESTLALAVDAKGDLVRAEPPIAQRLPRSGWQVTRHARNDLPITSVRTLEDTPFYARSLIRAGEEPGATLMHESLSLTRFESPWVQFLLPFRMPRRNTARR